MSDEQEKTDGTTSSVKYQALGKIFEKLLGLLTTVLPALFVYMMDRSKNRADSLESELDLKTKELDGEKEKGAVDDENKGKSSADIIGEFLADESPGDGKSDPK